jgi:hypothetical protein
MVAALKRERAAYEARGLVDRVAQVDEQLAQYGHEPSKGKQAQDDPPQGRTASAARQTTAKGK